MSIVRLYYEEWCVLYIDDWFLSCCSWGVIEGNMFRFLFENEIYVCIVDVLIVSEFGSREIS